MGSGPACLIESLESARIDRKKPKKILVPKEEYREQQMG